MFAVWRWRLSSRIPPPLDSRSVSLAPGVIDTDMQAQVRASDLASFPMRPKFDELKASGSLASPEDVAQRLCKHLFSDGFGKDPWPICGL